MTMQKARRRKGPGRPPGSRSQEGRQVLLRAARELLAEKGLPGTTLRAVAERAGVQPAMGNYYFGGKKGLLRAVIYEVAGEARDRMQQALETSGSPERRLRSIVDSWIEVMAADPYGARLMVEQVLFGEPEIIDEFVRDFANPTVKMIRSLLVQGRKAGKFRDVDPMYVIPAVVGMCIYFFLATPVFKRLFHVRKLTPEHVRRFAEQAGDLMMHGIAAEGAGR